MAVLDDNLKLLLNLLDTQGADSLVKRTELKAECSGELGVGAAVGAEVIRKRPPSSPLLSPSAALCKTRLVVLPAALGESGDSAVSQRRHLFVPSSIFLLLHNPLSLLSPLGLFTVLPPEMVERIVCEPRHRCL